MKPSYLSLIVWLGAAFTPKYTIEQHVLATLLADNSAMHTSPDSFTEITGHITNCDSRLKVGEGPAGQSQVAALQRCTTNTNCRAVTQGAPDDPTEKDNFYLCQDDSYLQNFAAAKKAAVFIKTAVLLKHLTRADAIVYANAQLPSGVCTDSKAESEEPVQEIIDWPIDKHSLGLQISAQISGGGMLLWDLSSCTKNIAINTQPEHATESIYIFLP